MKKKKFTRKIPCLCFLNKKIPVPRGYLKTDRRLYHAFSRLLDRFDPAGLVSRVGIINGYEYQAFILMDIAKKISDINEFGYAFYDYLVNYRFEGIPLDKKFYQRGGFKPMVEDAWALWRCFLFETHGAMPGEDIGEPLQQLSLTGRVPRRGIKTVNID